MTADSHDAHDLAGAFAVDALTREEREAFRRHLADCADCAHETLRQQEAAGWLALAAARTPPPRLKERVLAEVARTPQLPPKPPGPGGRRIRRSTPPLLHLALAASLAAAAALGGLAAWQHQEAQEARQEARSQAADLGRLFAAPDTTFVKKDLDYGGSGTVAISRDLNEAVYFCQDLAPLPADKTYQMWYVDPGDAVRSAGLLAAKAGLQSASLPPPGAAAALAVTVEPSAGSSHPTSDPVATWPLPTS
ncbi:anti-sigma factor [Streptomyces sp. NBC_01017]|uniref:anti-sigma factor n=1 Tax=Streptomyces sp. NBC_01017 TaxID=2903721 RepID=UPI003866F9C4|nr:anti-sigma factor [Streptomyces sp. NBC_01017]